MANIKIWHTKRKEGKEAHRAWGFYGHRLNLYRSTKPHEGFKILLDWCHSKSSYFVFTSNVDGHFQDAGFDPDRIVECHGAIRNNQCSQPCCESIWMATESVKVDESTMLASAPLPECNQCGGVARPNILMFGDWSWIDTNSESQARRFREWQTENRSARIVILEFGAGTAVPTVRWECERYNGRLIRINPRESQGPPMTLSLPTSGLEAIHGINSFL